MFSQSSFFLYIPKEYSVLFGAFHLLFTYVSSFYPYMPSLICLIPSLIFPFNPYSLGHFKSAVLCSYRVSSCSLHPFITLTSVALRINLSLYGSFHLQSFSYHLFTLTKVDFPEIHFLWIAVFIFLKFTQDYQSLNAFS